MKLLEQVSRITLIFTCITLAGACMSSDVTPPEKFDTQRPNILVIIADDMGYSDIGAFGSEIETPNIDRLAAEGMHFTNFHAAASCSPTRAMLISGVDNHLNGLGNMAEIQPDNQKGEPGYEGKLNQNVVTLPRLLKDAGYNTYMTGKWHLGRNPDQTAHARGFQRSFMLAESGADNWIEQPYWPFDDRVHYFEDETVVSLPTEDYFSSNFYTDKLIEFIDSDIESGDPFLAWVGYQAVHYPLQAPKEFIDKYDGVYDSGYDAIRQSRFDRQKEMGLIHPETELSLENSKTTNTAWKIPDWDSYSDEEKAFSARNMQTYAGMLDNMDANIGRLMTYLEETGVADNTIIIFMSDNGADPNILPLAPIFRDWYEERYDYVYMEDYEGDFSPMGQKGSFPYYGAGWAAVSGTPMTYYKAFSTSGGIRVPFVIRYPAAVAPGSKVEAFAHVKDVVPTLLELANVERPSGIYDGREVFTPDGTSLLPVLKGEADAVYEPEDMIGYELAGASALFKGEYKLMRNPPPRGTGEWELYNMIKDPGEIQNLSEDMPELYKEMIAAYEAYAKDVNLVPVPDEYNPLEQAVKNASK